MLQTENVKHEDIFRSYLLKLKLRKLSVTHSILSESPILNEYIMSSFQYAIR